MTDLSSPVPPGWGKDRGAAVQAPVPDPAGPDSINVALYPYVPEPNWFTIAVNQAWNQRHSDITLNWCSYDCYKDDPPSTLEVYAFDTIFASYFAQAGFLRPFNLDFDTDFFPWALAGLTAPGGEYWAVPYLGCMNILVYRVDDPDLGQPDLSGALLEEYLGDSPGNTVWPPTGQGLLVDFTGCTTDACMYLQMVMQNSDTFPVDPVLPNCPDGLDPTALGDLIRAVRIAGRPQATYYDTGYERISHFLGGEGRAYVGLTENLHFFPPNLIDQYTFRPLPLAESTVSTIPLFADAIAVNPATSSDKLLLAYELGTLIASVDVMLQAFWGVFPKGNPQYLTPVRPSVLATLAQNWPMYANILKALKFYETAAFRIGPNSRTWLNATKACLRDAIVGPGDELVFPADIPGYARTPAGLVRKP